MNGLDENTPGTMAGMTPGTTGYSEPYVSKVSPKSTYEEFLKPDTLPDDFSLGQSRYDFTQRVFPHDIGSTGSYNGHYMVINISTQTMSKMDTVGTGRGTGGPDDRGSQNSTKIFTPLPNELSKTDALRFNIDKNYFTNDERSYVQGLGNRPRFTRRIAESIALYMPNSELTFTDAHDYENISLTKFATSSGGAILGAGAAIAGGVVKGALSAIGAGNIVGDIAGTAGSIIGGGAQIMGTPINPKVELLYANTFQREFSFDFLFSPSSPEESKTLKEIIRTLRFHAAPEFTPGVAEQFFWLPPSEFDITFFNKGHENTNIPRVNTCALKQIDVSYAPAGVYSTYEDGMPVQTRVVLRFAETEVVHKLRVLQGF